jgi:hypothetical protein
MSLTTEQYLALSQFAYNNFNQSDVGLQTTTISWLIDNYVVEHEGEPVLDALSSIGGWRLIGFQPNAANGFAGMAFEDPDTGEQVFAFRGTEREDGFNVFVDDAATDLNVAIGRLPNQFSEANVFFNTMQDSHPSINVSFTGHSLGVNL